jgi:hypothetical protein
LHAPVSTKGQSPVSPTPFSEPLGRGDTDVTEIWISLDGSATWVPGDFVDPISRHAWRRWKYDWITPAEPGRFTLLARATGANQRTQPAGHNSVM